MLPTSQSDAVAIAIGTGHPDYALSVGGPTRTAESDVSEGQADGADHTTSTSSGGVVAIDGDGKCDHVSDRRRTDSHKTMRVPSNRTIRNGDVAEDGGGMLPILPAEVHGGYHDAEAIGIQSAADSGPVATPRDGQALRTEGHGSALRRPAGRSWDAPPLCNKRSA